MSVFAFLFWMGLGLSFLMMVLHFLTTVAAFVAAFAVVALVLAFCFGWRPWKVSP